jgi:hypothetical protein
MNTDMKWLALAFMFILGLPLVGLALEQYNRGQCRIEAIKANMEPDKIGQVCK